MAKKKTVERTKPVAMLESWDEVDERAYDVARYQLEIEENEAAMNQRIAAIQNEYADKIKELREKHDEAEAEVLAFADAHREDFGDKKSKKLSYGVLSFSKSDEKVELLVDEAIVIANLRKKNLHEGVIRTVESIDKNALVMKISDARERERIGFKVVQTGGDLRLKIDKKTIESVKIARRRAQRVASR